jgi:hypothetical protein
MYDITRAQPSQMAYAPEVVPSYGPLVVQPPSAEAIVAQNFPELAIAAMQQVVGQNVANMAMATGCAPRDLSEIQITNSRSWFGSSHTTTIRFRR